jgi:acyl-CoA-binding protein
LRKPVSVLGFEFLLYCFAGSYQPSHELMLRFYAYFKQATEGPCVAPRPAFWEVVKKMKWEAWNKLGNMSREEAMNNYVEELKKVWAYSFSICYGFGCTVKFFIQNTLKLLKSYFFTSNVALLTFGNSVTEQLDKGKYV